MEEYHILLKIGHVFSKLAAVDRLHFFRTFQAEISVLARGNSIHQKHFEGGNRDSNY